MCVLYVCCELHLTICVNVCVCVLVVKFSSSYVLMCGTEGL